MLQVIGSQVARGAGNIGLQPNVPSEPSELRTLDAPEHRVLSFAAGRAKTEMSPRTAGLHTAPGIH